MMVGQELRAALLDELMHRMAHHVDRGVDDAEALMLGVEEIKQIIRGTRLGLVRMLVDNAIRDALEARAHMTSH